MIWDEGFCQDLLEDSDDGIYFVDLDRTITHWNRGAQALSGFAAGEVIGRRCRAGLLNHLKDDGRQACATGCPLKAALEDGQPREQHMWMNHADGYRRPVWVRTVPVRDPQTRKIVGAVMRFFDDRLAVNARARAEHLGDLLLADPLTGLGNRDYFLSQLSSRYDEWVRYVWPFGVLFVWVNSIRRIADDHEHSLRETAVTVISRTLANSLSYPMILARYSDWKFAIIEPNGSHSTLTEKAEQLRALISSSRLMVRERLVKLSASFGGAVIAEGEDPQALMRRAEEALESSRQRGRNEITIDAVVT